MNQKLFPHEWLAILTGLSLLLGFCAVAYFFEQDIPEEIRKLSKENKFDLIEVSIEGAVERPGMYSLERGSSIQDLFNQAIPIPQANLSPFHLSAKLRNKQKIKVQKTSITIFLEGAVSSPGPLEIPFGSSVNDLIALSSFPEGANLNPLKKKRKLKDQEVIQVNYVARHSDVE